MEESLLSQVLGPVLVNLSLQFPLYLVLLVGIVLAAMRRREAPTRYGLVLAALLLHLVLSVVSTVFNMVVPTLASSRGYPVSSLSFLLSAVGVVNIFGHAVGYMLLFVALFWRRSLERPGQAAGSQVEKPTPL